jgi:hypothetical protein
MQGAYLTGSTAGTLMQVDAGGVDPPVGLGNHTHGLHHNETDLGNFPVYKQSPAPLDPLYPPLSDEMRKSIRGKISVSISILLPFVMEMW